MKKWLVPGKIVKKFSLIVKPAIVPEERHRIEKVLTKIGYYVDGGGTNVDMSQCDISFQKEV